jgi:hypothetical protein
VSMLLLLDQSILLYGYLLCKSSEFGAGTEIGEEE